MAAGPLPAPCSARMQSRVEPTLVAGIDPFAFRLRGTLALPLLDETPLNPRHSSTVSMMWPISPRVETCGSSPVLWPDGSAMIETLDPAYTRAEAGSMSYRSIRFIASFLAFVALWAGAGVLGPVIATQRAAAPQQTAALAHRESGPETYIISFGLFGDQSVFESEARGAAGILREAFRTKTAPIISFNRKRGGAASGETLAAALRTAGAAMNPDRDVLVVMLTSHGSPEGLDIVAGNMKETLTPLDLHNMLDASGARYRVVIISACYSGIFVPLLADARTLVITAAAANRPSFGCEDGALWTYFGDAFFNRALRKAPNLEAAFDTARRLVKTREQREGFEPSHPQIAGGAEVLALLSRRDRLARSSLRQ